MRHVSTVLAALVLAALMFAGAKAATIDHPADGQATRDVSISYGTQGYGWPAAWSTGDLSFGGPYPLAADLMPVERYMLAGTKGSNAPDGHALQPWVKEIESLCLDYGVATGRVPSELSLGMLSTARGISSGKIPAWERDLYRNPLTNEYPSLSARSFAPGEFYVRALSDEEVTNFARRNRSLRDAWVDGLQVDATTGRVGNVSLLGPVLYVRAYGVNGVIYENLAWRMSEPVYPAAEAEEGDSTTVACATTTPTG